MLVTENTLRAPLEVLCGSPPAPPDGHLLGWKLVRPDLRARYGFRYPWPGGVAEQDGPEDGEPCGSGLHLAKTWAGAAGGCNGCTTALLLAYRPDDVLGEDRDKLRVRRALVLDVIDVIEAVRLRGFGADFKGAVFYRADLHSANLRGSRLSGVSLAGADLSGSDLCGTNLCSANLLADGLREAGLSGAIYNVFTRWPKGFDPEAAGCIRYEAATRSESPGTLLVVA